MFSDREEEIIKAIGRRKLSFEEIANKVFGYCNKPFDANITIANSVKRIVAKCEYHNLNWTLGRVKKGRKFLIYKEKK